MSGIIEDFAKVEKLPLNNREDYANASKIMNGKNPDIFIETIEKTSQSTTSGLLVVDGLRAPKRVIALQKSIGMKVLAIEVDPNTRYERRSHNPRERDKNIESFEDFLKEDGIDDPGNEEIDRINVGYVMRMAGVVTIENNGSKAEFRQKLHHYFSVEQGFKPVNAGC